MANRIAPHPGRQAGFTIVELMIAVVLGLLTVLIVSQVLLQAETRRRTIASGSDAQLNGALSLYTLQRDIQMAGYGSNAIPAVMGCKLNRQFGSTGTARQTPLAPVVITAGANGAPDQITVLQARTRQASMPMGTKEIHNAKSSESFVVDSAMGVNVGDMMAVAPPTITDYASSDCRLFQVAGTTLSLTNIPHARPTTTGQGSWNHDQTFSSSMPDKSVLINMGSPVLRTYSVSAQQNLVASDVSWTNGNTPQQENLFAQIVNLQALYGKDTNADGVVDTYNKTTPTTPAGWQEVLTVRLVVVARSDKREMGNVTAAQPTWDVGTQHTYGDVATADCNDASKCVTLKVNHLTDWQRYRYKVYDTVVPLRNVLWHS
jgi:type IV pilus assembly protein PilW